MDEWGKKKKAFFFSLSNLLFRLRKVGSVSLPLPLISNLSSYGIDKGIRYSDYHT